MPPSNHPLPKVMKCATVSEVQISNSFAGYDNPMKRKIYDDQKLKQQQREILKVLESVLYKSLDDGL
jgi:hypothetical protein